MRPTDFYEWINRFQNQIYDLAEEGKNTTRDYACTFLGAVVGVNYAAYMQVGDGAIVIATNDEQDAFKCVFWPQNGEYANSTNFLTEKNVVDKFNFDLTEERCTRLAMFTDGIQSMVLQYRDQTAHAPFFSGVHAQLAKVPVEGRSASLSELLGGYLSSAQVNKQTDDDKTLLIASRLRTIDVRV